MPHYFTVLRTRSVFLEKDGKRLACDVEETRDGKDAFEQRSLFYQDIFPSTVGRNNNLLA
jgi:hypothetical protein